MKKNTNKNAVLKIRHEGDLYNISAMSYQSQGQSFVNTRFVDFDIKGVPILDKLGNDSQAIDKYFKKIKRKIEVDENLLVILGYPSSFNGKASQLGHIMVELVIYSEPIPGISKKVIADSKDELLTKSLEIRKLILEFF